MLLVSQEHLHRNDICKQTLPPVCGHHFSFVFCFIAGAAVCIKSNNCKCFFILLFRKRFTLLPFTAKKNTTRHKAGRVLILYVEPPLYLCVQAHHKDVINYGAE